MDMTYMENYGSDTTESFIMFCDDMMIADEGFGDVMKSIGQGFVRIIKAIWDAFVRLIRKFTEKVRLLFGQSKKSLKKDNAAKEEKIQELDREIENLKKQLNKSQSETSRSKMEVEDTLRENEDLKKQRTQLTDAVFKASDKVKKKDKELKWMTGQRDSFRNNYNESTQMNFSLVNNIHALKNKIAKLEKEKEDLQFDLDVAEKGREREGEFNRMISALKRITTNYSMFLKQDISKANRGIPILQNYVTKCSQYRGDRYSSLQGRYKKKVANHQLSYENNMDEKDEYALRELTNIYDEDDNYDFKNANSGSDFSDIESWRSLVNNLDDTRFQMFKTLIMMITKELSKWQSDLEKVKNQLEGIAKVADSITDQVAKSKATRATSKPVKWFNYRVRYTGNLITKYMSLLKTDE